MSYDILVVKSPNNGYVARMLAWPEVVAHGNSRTEVLTKMQNAMAALWSEGEIVQLDMPTVQKTTERNPWIENFGRFKDDPTFDDLLSEIAQYRQTSKGDAE